MEGQISQVIKEILNRGGNNLIQRLIDRLRELIDSNTAGPSNMIGAGHKRRAPSIQSEDLFDMHESPITSTATSQGRNLMLENRSGTPIRDELANLHRHELHKEEIVTFNTTYQFVGNNTQDETCYIPWESLVASHSQEVIAPRLVNAYAWKPLSAEVVFDTGRAWIEELPTNANNNHKDVGDFPIQFLLMGEEAPLNLTFFQPKSDHHIWTSYVAPTLLPTQECIHRKVYSGFSAYGALPVAINDPAWHQKILGRDSFGRFEWRHEGHLESPWRLRNKLLESFVDSSTFQKDEATFNTSFHYYSTGDLKSMWNYGLSRFDYLESAYN